MPEHRFRAAVAAAILTAVVTGSVAAAAPGGAAVQRGSDPRFISIEGIEPQPERFYVKGEVEPEYQNRAAVLQRKVGRSGRWKAWKDFDTNGQSKYRERIKALRRVGRVFYRVKVEASGSFRTSFSGVVFIHTVRE